MFFTLNLDIDTESSDDQLLSDIKMGMQQIEHNYRDMLIALQEADVPLKIREWILWNAKHMTEWADHIGRNIGTLTAREGN